MGDNRLPKKGIVDSLIDINHKLKAIQRQLCCSTTPVDTGVTTFNTRTGDVTLVTGDVTTALGFTPYNATNPSNYIALSSPITGYVVGSNAALAATDTLLQAFGKIQGSLNGKINNQATVQAGAVYNVVRGIITQAAGGTSATQFPANQVDALTVTGGKGASTTFSGTTAQGARGGQINITGGAGGDISVATGGAAGQGGQVRLLAGNGGNASSAGTTAGQGGVAELQAGDAGVSSGGANVAQPGYASVKAGNAAITGNGNGGDVFLIGGMGNGTGKAGNIYLGTGPGGSFANARGNIAIAGDTGFPPVYKLELNGDLFLSNKVAPTTPTGGGVIYVDSTDNDLHYVDASGINTNLTGGLKGGTATFNADGSLDSFTIPHGLTSVTAHVVTRNSDSGGNLFETQISGANINVHFVSGAPANGLVIVVNWMAFGS